MLRKGDLELEAEGEVRRPELAESDDEVCGDLDGFVGRKNKGGAGGVNIEAAAVCGGESGESIALACGNFASVVKKDGVEGELEIEVWEEIEAQFEIGDGGGECFGFVLEVEAGSATFF